MNLDLVWGLLTLVVCTAALILLAPAALRAARAAYAESVEKPEWPVWPPRRPAGVPAPRCIRASDDPVRPLRPAA